VIDQDIDVKKILNYGKLTVGSKKSIVINTEDLQNVRGILNVTNDDLEY